MATYTETQEARFGRDMVLPGEGATVQPTASGDWPTIAGRPNLLAAHRRRAITQTRSMVHRSEYGGNLPAFVELLANPSELARMTVGLRQNALRDGRISEATAVAGGIAGRAGAVKVALEITPRGSDTTETTEILQE